MSKKSLGSVWEASLLQHLVGAADEHAGEGEEEEEEHEKGLRLRGLVRVVDAAERLPGSV